MEKRVSGSQFRSHQIAEMIKENKISIKQSGFIWNFLRFTTQIRFHPFWLVILRLSYTSRLSLAINISLKARTLSAYNLLRHTVRMREGGRGSISFCALTANNIARNPPVPCHSVWNPHRVSFEFIAKNTCLSKQNAGNKCIWTWFGVCATAMVIFSWLFISSISQSEHTIRWINQWVKALNKKSIFSKQTKDKIYVVCYRYINCWTFQFA